MRLRCLWTVRRHCLFASWIWLRCSENLKFDKTIELICRISSAIDSHIASCDVIHGHELSETCFSIGRVMANPQSRRVVVIIVEHGDNIFGEVRIGTDANDHIVGDRDHLGDGPCVPQPDRVYPVTPTQIHLHPICSDPWEFDVVTLIIRLFSIRKKFEISNRWKRAAGNRLAPRHIGCSYRHLCGWRSLRIAFLVGHG